VGKRTYNMLIGEQMAERIKIGIGSASPFPAGDETRATDRD